MRNHFDEQLEKLNRELTAMGGLCENAIAQAAKALLTGDLALAETVTETAAQIDRQEKEIENLCLKLLLQQQPVARDLRIISSALKMITDLERIGHQAADIADIIANARLRAEDEETLCFGDMARAVIKMVTDSIDAFVKKDKTLACAVIDYDDVVDDCFEKNKQALTRIFARSEQSASYALDLLMVAKYLERIGDHAVNVAEWVLFSLTGMHVEGR